MGRDRRLVARLRRDVDQLERPRGEALAEVEVAQCHERAPYAHALLRHRRLGPAGQPAVVHAARAQGHRGDRARGDVLRARDRRARGPHDPGLRARRGGRRHRRAVRPTARPAGARHARAQRARPARRPLRADAGVRRGALSPWAAALPGAGGGRGGTGVDDRRLRAVRRAGAAGPLDPGWRERRARGRGRRVGDALGARVRDLPRRDLLRAAGPPPAAQADAVGRPAADRRAQAQGRLRRRRRSVAPHARRDRRLRGGLRRLRDERRARHLGRRSRRGRDGHPDRAPAAELHEAARPGALRARLTRGLQWVWMANGDNGVQGRARQRAYCIGVSPTVDDLSELQELLRTAGVAVVGELVQHREKPHPNLYLGSGKVDELKPLLKAADANLVAIDDELTPRQERNLEEALGIPVIDRTAVILDIFAGHAHTADGKLQVELAQLEYNMARMRGLWTHLERLGAGRGVGGIGTRGPGESQIETDSRLARDRISALRRRLEHVKSNRKVMRAERERAHLPNVALAGYTNAGKSTLLNRLTGAEVGVRDRLFHTLDPTTRTLRLHGRTYLVTDTVGFIRKLPHQLVNAFAATLEETKLADLVLHVVDSHVPEDELELMTRAVDDVLEEIGAGDTPRLLVLNKADLLDEERRRELSFRHPEGLLVSAVTGEGLEAVGEAIADAFERSLQDVELLVPFSEGQTLSELHDVAGDLEREDTADGVRVTARLPAVVAERYDRYADGRDGSDGAA